MDAEKVFDRVDWDYMREALTVTGLQPCMLTHVMALYSSPTVCVKVNGHLSDAYTIGNGTRQGCPLSPLIYVLTLEPFLNKLRLNTYITEVQIGDREFKVAAYADDILLSLRSPLITLPNLLKDIEYFGTLSNFKVKL